MTTTIQLTDATDPTRRSPQPCDGAPLRVLARCGDGRAQPSLATELSVTRTFVRSDRPPSVRSKVTLTLCPAGEPLLPPLDGLVVAIRIDPLDADRTGYEVAFTCVVEEQADALERLATRFPALPRTAKPVPIPARPTVPALHASLRFAEPRSLPPVVVDLSSV
jgi:hypothetical protein